MRNIPALKVALIILTVLTLLSNSGIIFSSGYVSVPVRIRLEGRIESGSVSEGFVLRILSGSVVIDDKAFNVRTDFRRDLGVNIIRASLGKMNSSVISLNDDYTLFLAAIWRIKETGTIELRFGYGENYPGFTGVVYGSGRQAAYIPIEAVGELVFSGNRATITASGKAVLGWGNVEQEGRLIVVSKKLPIKGETVRLQAANPWQVGMWEDEDNYYVVVPKGTTLTLFLSLDPKGKIYGLLSTYGLSSPQGLPVTVSSEKREATVADILAEYISESLSEFIIQEREFASKSGFNAERYLRDVNYSILLLNESMNAFEKGDLEAGSGLFEKGIEKAKSSLEALSQAKSDCISMFLFLAVFTFFLSFIVSAMVEKRKTLVNLGLFTVLILAEIALIPQVRVAISLFSPERIYRLSSTSLTLSLFTAVIVLLLIGMLIFEAKGTIFSDLFWYSVKNMKKRVPRTVLTIITIAVVSAASSSLLSTGTVLNIRETTYPSTFRGISISLHNTTVTYVFRGIGQQNDLIYQELYEPIPDWQARWLSSMDWVEKKYVVLASRTLVTFEEKRIFVYQVATNASTVEGIIVSPKLAELFGIREGDYIFLGGKRVNVKILNGSLMFIDGVPPDEFGDYLIITSLEHATKPASLYRLILEGNVPEDVARQLLEASYDTERRFYTADGEVTVQSFTSFRVGFGSGSGTKCLLIVGEFQYFASALDIIVLLGLSSLMIITTLLGSLHQRKGEYSTMSALGASPGHVSLLMLIEGMSYGLIGGVIGYVLSQFLQVYVSNPIAPIQSYVFSPMFSSFLIAVASSILGSIIPARRVILKVVPSQFLLRKIEEVSILDDHAEAVIPLRILGDAESFVKYASSLTQRPPPMNQGPIYTWVSPRRKDRKITGVEMIVSYRGERVAKYKVELLLPDNPGSTIKAMLYPAEGKWDIDHKFCAREMLTVLREDLLQYIDWKKKQQTASLTLPSVSS
ncbi:MAG: FtsX-like permease family protein [Crenarchaeota archaeon]|nr:FtsX-like permease family protein [Thermoproteota archaeon]MDW8033635.1 FtsX-like permease family protein [Nitrososphaerota archaeon]